MRHARLIAGPVFALTLTVVRPADAQTAPSPAAPWSQPVAGAPATVAPPQSPQMGAPDVVTTLDGQAFRGRATDVAPGASVTMVLEDGSSRRFVWNQLRSVSGPSFAAPPAAAPVAPVFYTPPLPMVGPGGEPNPDDDQFDHPLPGRVRVEIVSRGAPQRIGYIVLDEFTHVTQTGFGATAHAYVQTSPAIARPLCVTPCTRWVPTGVFSFSAVADGIRTSISHPVVTEDTRIELHAAPAGRALAGAVIAAAGVVFSLAGLVGLVAGAGLSSVGDQGAGTAFALSGTGFGVGAASIGVGVGLLVSAPAGIARQERLSSRALSLSVGLTGLVVAF